MAPAGKEETRSAHSFSVNPSMMMQEGGQLMINTSSDQGLSQEAFREAITAFPFVPKFFVDPAIRWLQLDGVVVDPESLLHFMREALVVKSDVKFPLAFAVNYNRGNQQGDIMSLVLQSQGVSNQLAILIEQF
jgi:hypothetical protein